MTKRKIVIFVALAALLIILFLIYWFYFSKPESFLSEEQVVDQINDTFAQAEAVRIQDTVDLDEEHVFVPFVTNSDEYGVSYWEWNYRKWGPVYISTSGEPMLWKIKPEKPSTYHILWNINPKDELSYFKYHLVRDRSYHIVDERHTYTPRIQIEHEIPVEENTYGVFNILEGWQSLYGETATLLNDQTPNLNIFESNLGTYFGWTPYNQFDEQSYPESSLNGERFSNGAMTEFLRFVDETDLKK
mgnify:CR=1 FL=1